MPVDPELLARFDTLITMVREVQAEQRQVKDEMRQMKDEMRQMKDVLAHQGERISRMEGRLDEQSRILAALIPTRLAAVPSAA